MGWRSLSDLKEQKTATVVSCGVIIHEDDEKIIICPHMILEDNGKRWRIQDYDGKTQTFALGIIGSNTVAAASISMGDEVKIFTSFQNVSSIVKTGSRRVSY